MNKQQKPRAIDLVHAGLKRRHAAERRFRRYGFAAILVGISFLVLLFLSIFSNGYSAFVQTYVQLDIEYDNSKIDPEGRRDYDAISSGDYSGIVKASMRERFPWVKKRKDKRKLYGIVSTGAAFQLRKLVLDDPELIGTQSKLWAPMDDDADMFFKGYVTSLNEYPGQDALDTSVDGKTVKFTSGKESFKYVLTQISQHLADTTRNLERDLQTKQGLLAESTGELEKLKVSYEQFTVREDHAQAEQVKEKIDATTLDVDRYLSEISSLKEILDERSRRKGAVGVLQPLTSDMSSFLVKVNGGLVKLTAVSAEHASGEIIAPLSSEKTAQAGSWKIVHLQTPESDRRLSDQQVAWLLILQDQGKVEKRFNKTFFTAGDSREPELAGIWSATKGSFYALIVTLLLSFPIGVAAAIYLEEFAPLNRWTDLIEVNINNLAAVPSIVFGLLGLAMFINFFGLPRSAPLVGGLVLTLMTLPTIIIASRAALKSVPPSIREAALGLGASRVQMVFYHVMPLAVPGMLTGTIIGMARALGESAPLLMIGMVAFIVDIPQGFFDPATVLPVQIYLWADSPERAFVERTSAATMVLLVFLIVMNTLAVILRKRFERRW